MPSESTLNSSTNLTCYSSQLRRSTFNHTNCRRTP